MGLLSLALFPGPKKWNQWKPLRLTLSLLTFYYDDQQADDAGSRVRSSSPFCHWLSIVRIPHVLIHEERTKHPACNRLCSEEETTKTGPWLHGCGLSVTFTLEKNKPRGWVWSALRHGTQWARRSQALDPSPSIHTRKQTGRSCLLSRWGNSSGVTMCSAPARLPSKLIKLTFICGRGGRLLKQCLLLYFNLSHHYPSHALVTACPIWIITSSYYNSKKHQQVTSENHIWKQISAFKYNWLHK